MVRKQIYIKKRQNELLKRLSREQGLSEAEIIRQAIERELTSNHRSFAFGRSGIDRFALLALSKRGGDVQGEPYVWNREEIYEERENRWVRDQDEG
jgi:hypothetical protein